MRIEHLAIWVNDLDKMKNFYEIFFNAQSGDPYYNPTKNFSSYFLSFENGCRLELMHKPEIPGNLNNIEKQSLGLIHFAISVGSKDKVDQLTNRIREAEYRVIGEPRTTGDGYYESVILDPENNRIEITI